MLKLYPGLLKHINCILAVMVAALGYYPLDSAVNNKHGAGSAGGHPAVQGGAVNGNPPLGGLANGVLLGMDGSYAMGGNIAVLVEHFFKQMPDVVAVGKAGGRAYIACNQNLLVLGDYAAGAPPLAGRPLGNGFAHFHKVFVPAWSFIFAHLYPLFIILCGFFLFFKLNKHDILFKLLYIVL
jgi:hypothetical protein